MTTKHFADGAAVPAIGLGMFDYGGKMEADPSRDETDLAAIHNAVKAGYRHFDTAEVYSAGHSEELLGQALQQYDRSELFITTKVSPKHLRYDDVLAACDRSLKRLQTDYIDMYLIHWPSEEIPLDESFRALNELVDKGKIKRIGVSNFDVPLLEKSVKLCETPLASNQVHYNVLYRKPQENGAIQFCQEHDILITAYSPVKDGVLNNATVKEIANNVGASPAQVALQWLVQQSHVITIPKSGNAERQQENLAAAEVQLSDNDVQRLDVLG